MIVIGAKGFAKELLEELVSSKYGYNTSNLYFFDDISKNTKKVFGKFKILTSLNQVETIFKNDSTEFCIGLGNPIHRLNLSEKFTKIGGKLTTIISHKANVGSFNTKIGEGSTIIGNATITNSVTIGKGALIYMNTSITHDVTLGDFVEISPNVAVLGRSNVGDFTSLGSGCIVLPDITIGKNCIIGAGTVVTKDVPDNMVVAGIPGKILKENSALMLKNK